LSLHALSYDHNMANQKMLANPLPTTYAETLLTGLWDNMEILPELERTTQGLSIDEINKQNF